MRPHETRPFVVVMNDTLAMSGFTSLAGLFLADRDARFRKGNDETWGEGSWVRCRVGCLDTLGYPAYHHQDHHR